MKHAPTSRPPWRPPRPDLGFGPAAGHPDQPSDRVSGGPISRVGEVISSVGSFLPAIILVVLVAAAGYLVVANAPTPVVKERQAGAVPAVTEFDIKEIVNLVLDSITMRT